MLIDAIQFEKNKEPKSHACGTINELLIIKDTLQVPIVWVITTDQFPSLQKFGNVIEDLGQKHKGRQLSLILSRRKLIPLLDGDFSSVGKLLQSITIFLKSNTTPRNLYIIGTSKEINASLRRRFKLDTRKTSYASSDIGHSNPAEVNEKISAVPASSFIGNSEDACRVRDLIQRAADVDMPVLITGDTGTGKEIVASEIHKFSKQKHPGQLVPVNCGAIPPYLLDSELFGHVKGSFTGAIKNKKGLWIVANNGTLFLDEIGDLTLDHQAKILRALQEGKVRPVGAQDEESANARIVAATNRDLLSMVQARHFREDLYYRLRYFIIHTPTLRDHPEDIPIIVKEKWKKITKKEGVPKLDDDLIDMLRNYTWPGNVRELMMILHNLYGLYRTETNLGASHLRKVFEIQGIVFNQNGNRTTPADELRNVPIGYVFRNLRLTQEVVHAAEYTLLPLIKDNIIDQASTSEIALKLQDQCNDLEYLCRKPDHFAPQTYEAINLLRSKLMYFRAKLLVSPTEALMYWRENAKNAFDDVKKAVSGEIETSLNYS
ncbi:MAG: sigma-54-dependent Fis family transcriptional regulator [Syntrophaceae bacterium]|nr:sigma-54-dependent Fis family transcriptional regulator [Syntrophaceae bacterium]